MNKFLIIMAGLIFSNFAHAQVSIETMMNNFVSTVNPMIGLLEAISYVGGLYIAIKAIILFIEVSKNNSQVPISRPILMIVISAMLMSMPVTLEMATSSIYGSSGPGAYLAPETNNLGAASRKLIENVIIFLKLVGFVSFVRGFFLLNKTVEKGQDLFAKGMTHIIGGVLLINFKATVSILAASTGVVLPF